jgi:hypothetical protein
MAKHHVLLKLPAVPINGEIDVVFKVKVNGKPLGELIVQRDSLTWHPIHTALSVLKVSWTAFDEWMRARNELLR